MFQIRRTTVTALTMATFLAVACDKGSETEAKPEPAKSESKTDEAKADGAGEAKADGADEVAKADEAKADEAKADEAKADEAEADEAAEGGEADEAAAEGGDEAPEAVADEATEVAAAEPGKPGPAYFAVRDKGVVMLDGGTFTKVENSPDKLVKEIKAGPDGGVYLLGFEGILELKGATIGPAAETKLGGPTGNLEDFAITKDGEFWAVGYKGVSHFSNGAWETEEKSVLGADVKLLRGVAVDAKDRVWVTSANDLHLRDGDKWVTVDTSKFFKRQAFFEGVGTGPEGVAMAIGSSKMLKLVEPDAIETIKVGKKFAMLSKLGFSQIGIGGLKTSIDVVTRVGDDGKTTNYKAGKVFAADRIEDVTPDDSGRLWVASDAGVAILGPDKEVVEWMSGSVDELAGQVEVIGIVGSGPELPGEVGPVKTGGMKGKILQGGAGLADVEVEICPKPSSFFRKSPCADSPTRRVATTDADGNFEMTDVPLGAYGLAVKVGKKWQLTFGSEYGAGMKEGEVFDIGSVKLNEPE